MATMPLTSEKNYLEKSKNYDDYNFYHGLSFIFFAQLNSTKVESKINFSTHENCLQSPVYGGLFIFVSMEIP